MVSLAAMAVLHKADGLVADEIVEVKEGIWSGQNVAGGVPLAGQVSVIQEISHAKRVYIDADVSGGYPRQ
jgi:hypothetical protein